MEHFSHVCHGDEWFVLISLCWLESIKNVMFVEIEHLLLGLGQFYWFVHWWMQNQFPAVKYTLNSNQHFPIRFRQESTKQTRTHTRANKTSKINSVWSSKFLLVWFLISLIRRYWSEKLNQDNFMWNRKPLFETISYRTHMCSKNRNWEMLRNRTQFGRLIFLHHSILCASSFVHQTKFIFSIHPFDQNHKNFKWKSKIFSGFVIPYSHACKHTHTHTGHTLVVKGKSGGENLTAISPSNLRFHSIEMKKKTYPNE